MADASDPAREARARDARLRMAAATGRIEGAAVALRSADPDPAAVAALLEREAGELTRAREALAAGPDGPAVHGGAPSRLAAIAGRIEAAADYLDGLSGGRRREPGTAAHLRERVRDLRALGDEFRDARPARPREPGGAVEDRAAVAGDAAMLAELRVLLAADDGARAAYLAGGDAEARLSRGRLTAVLALGAALLGHAPRLVALAGEAGRLAADNARLRAALAGFAVARRSGHPPGPRCLLCWASWPDGAEPAHTPDCALADASPGRPVRRGVDSGPESRAADCPLAAGEGG